LEHFDVDGIKTPKRSVINHNGKKLLETEVTEAKYLEKVDDAEFAKP
jgi:hypothetical protein